MAIYEVEYLDGEEKKIVYMVGLNEAEVSKNFSSTYPNVSADNIMNVTNMVGKNQIEIVDVKMPFISMVVFMVKAAIAAIPAFIILLFLWALLRTMLGGGRF